MANASVELLEKNLNAQLQASEELLNIVYELATAAKDQQNAAVSEAIAPQLEKLVKISGDLTSTANSAAQALRR